MVGQHWVNISWLLGCIFYQLVYEDVDLQSADYIDQFNWNLTHYKMHSLEVHRRPVRVTDVTAIHNSKWVKITHICLI